MIGGFFVSFFAGSLSDFIQHSAVHEKLAAIGIIIFSKQTPILLGIDPSTLKGISPNGTTLRINVNKNSLLQGA